MADRILPTLTLSVVRDGETVSEHAFTEESITIGRSDAALFVVEDEALAEMHAVINVEDDGSIQLLDLGAGDLTVEGEAVESNATLADGTSFALNGVHFVLAITTASDDAGEEPASLVDVRPEGAESDDAMPDAGDDASAEASEADAEDGTDAEATDAVGDQAAAAVAAAEAADPEKDDATDTAVPQFVPPVFEGEALEDVLEFVLKSGTGQGNHGLDTKSPKVLEVNEIWNNVLLDTKHFDAKHDVTVGDAVGFKWSLLGVPVGWVPGNMVGPLRLSPPIWSEVVSDWREDFFASDDDLPGGATQHVLFEPAGKATYKARLDPSWGGFLEKDGERIPLSELEDKGLAKTEGSLLIVSLTEDTRLLVEVGGVMFFAHVTYPGKKVVVPFAQTLDYPFLSTFLFCSLMGLLAGFFLAFSEPPARTGLDEVEDRFVELLVEKPPPEEKKNDKPEANPDAGEGAKAKKEEGKTGKKDAKMKEAKGAKRDIQQAQRDREIAENAGLLGAMDDMGGQDGVFGSGSLSSSVTGGIGGLIGAKGTQIGAGGLGSRGSGLGGGGTAEGLGGLGTRGAGGGRSGYGKGGGSFGPKGSGGISAASGNPIIMGALDRALIDAVIKRKMNQIKYCYQRELQKDPSLGGKLVIQFTISGNGSVAKATPKQTMGSPAVDKCVVDRFYAMQFPEPKGGGIVIVSYPFIFSPG